MLSLLAILWNSAFKWEYLFFSPLLFASLLFTGICKASSDSHFAFLHFFFWGKEKKGLPSLSSGPHFVRTLHHDLSWVTLHSMAHSFIDLDKAVVHVIRLVSFLLLWFLSLYPLMPSLSTYHLTGVSLTLDLEYVLMADAPDLGRSEEHTSELQSR